jgi:nucleoside 2-deoxyribosyltransferase
MADKVEKSTCFIIMPLTTPEALVQIYSKDADHFSHVLEHLFVPAINKAEFRPIRPIAQGADVIQAEIIKNLETADLVLCDISSLNPNVFFELGCRTALNRPVCHVMDDLTHVIPFDTGIINHHKYSHALAPWTLADEIERLSAHIRASAERSAGNNMLWQYFGLKSSAHASKSQGDEQDRLAYLVMQTDAIRKHLEESSTAYASLPITNYVTGGEAYFPAGTATFNNLTTLASLHPDWNKLLEQCESELQQIARVKRQMGTLPDVDSVKWSIEQNIKSLGELIDSEPQSQRAAKARALQLQFRALLP